MVNCGFIHSSWLLATKNITALIQSTHTSSTEGLRHWSSVWLVFTSAYAIFYKVIEQGRSIVEQGRRRQPDHLEHHGLETKSMSRPKSKWINQETLDKSLKNNKALDEHIHITKGKTNKGANNHLSHLRSPLGVLPLRPPRKTAPTPRHRPNRETAREARKMVRNKRNKR